MRLLRNAGYLPITSQEGTLILTLFVPTRLRCEWLVTPLGIDTLTPRLSWELCPMDTLSAADQSAYRLSVATTPALLQASMPDIWETGLVSSAEQALTYAGPALTSGARYFWHVQVWDQNGEISASNEPSWWEMGLLTPDDWEADWIHLPLAVPANNPCTPPRYLRRTFSAAREVQRARLYITAKGLYEATLNGQRVGHAWLTPGWTDYDERVQYQTYDVSELITREENVLGVILGSGWYSGHISNSGPYFYGSSPQLFAQLELEYADGTSERVVSDEQWRASTGPLIMADLLKGETYDARREEEGWDRPHFADQEWQAVTLLPQNTSPRLVADCAQPVQTTEILPPRQITRLDHETHLVDFGQNLVGWVRLNIPPHAQDPIRLRHAEMLDSAGQLYVANLRTAEQTDTYLPADSADGVTYMPRFTFHGFRYVEVRGYPGDLPPDALQARVIGSDTPRIGAFSCGHPLVNQLYQNIIWGQRGNFISIPTDCPQRDERLGWLGDAHIFARTAAYNMDVAAFFTKWMHDVLDEQSANGAFSDAAPRVMLPSNAAPAWGDAGVIVPWTMYRMYGDKHIIETSWEAMTRWMAYLKAANPGGLRLARSANNYGDWLALDGETENHLLATRTPKDLLATAYYAYTARLMAEMARMIDRPDEAVAYEALHKQIVHAFVATYVQPDGRILSETQTSYVLALAFDLLPHELRAAAARYLVEDIQRRGWHLATGFVGVGYLLPVLTELGYADVAYRLLLQESYPSWGYSIRQGATTIWERWDGWTQERGFQDPAMNSFNHYSLGSVGEWLYRFVGGIEPLPSVDGRGQFRIRPHPSASLTWARTEWHSVYGLVSSYWLLKDGMLSLEISLPPNTRCTLTLPTSSPSAGQQAPGFAREAERAQFANGASEIRLGAGHHTFEIPYAPSLRGGTG